MALQFTSLIAFVNCDESFTLRYMYFENRLPIKSRSVF